MPPSQQTSGAAIASLICGIVGCVPVITSVVAVILGIVGIRKTRDPRYSGKGLAIGGLILGIIGILVWSGISAVMYVAYVKVKPVMASASSFVQELSAGDIAAARKHCTPALTNAELLSQSKSLQAMGQFSGYKTTGVDAKTNNGVSSVQIQGTATYAKGTRAFTIIFSESGQDFKISSFSQQ
jgi:hypothetical protein